MLSCSLSNSNLGILLQYNFTVDLKVSWPELGFEFAILGLQGHELFDQQGKTNTVCPSGLIRLCSRVYCVDLKRSVSDQSSRSWSECVGAQADLDLSSSNVE